MIGRLIRIFFFVALIVFIVSRLLNRQQKQSVNEIIVISAWVCLIASALALLWYTWSA